MPEEAQGLVLEEVQGLVLEEEQFSDKILNNSMFKELTTRVGLTRSVIATIIQVETVVEMEMITEV